MEFRLAHYSDLLASNVSHVFHEDLFMFVLSVSQCPTKAFSCSSASVPPPAAGFGTGMTPMPNTRTAKTFVKLLIDRPPVKYCLHPSRKWTTRNPEPTPLPPERSSQIVALRILQSRREAFPES